MTMPPFRGLRSILAGLPGSLVTLIRGDKLSLPTDQAVLMNMADAYTGRGQPALEHFAGEALIVKHYSKSRRRRASSLIGRRLLAIPGAFLPFDIRFFSQIVTRFVVAT